MVSRSSELVAIPSRGMRECADESATPLAATVHAMRRLSSRNTAEAPEIRPKRLRSSAHCCLRVPRAAFAVCVAGNVFDDCGVCGFTSVLFWLAVVAVASLLFDDENPATSLNGLRFGTNVVPFIL